MKFFWVGGMFVVNVALARTQSRQGYGLFALAYSAFAFLMALHNAAILETFTVYGAARYQKHLDRYLGLVWRSNISLGLVLSAVLTLLWVPLRFSAPEIASRTILGALLSCAVLLSAVLCADRFISGGGRSSQPSFRQSFFAVASSYYGPLFDLGC